MLTNIIITAFIGLCLSVYAFWIERKIKNNPQYKPACDISGSISCSKPFKSSFANFFGIPNSIAGIAYYLAIMALASLELKTPLLMVTLAGVFATLWLAYILYTKIKSFCVVCSATYIVNILLILFAWNAFI